MPREMKWPGGLRPREARGIRRWRLWCLRPQRWTAQESRPRRLPRVAGSTGTHQALTSPVVAVGGRAGVGVRAAAIHVPVPARREDPCRKHGEAAAVAGGRGPHLCPAPGDGRAGCESPKARLGGGGAGAVGAGRGRGWGGGSASSPEVVPTLGAVELRHAPHLVAGHRVIALPALPAAGHLGAWRGEQAGGQRWTLVA